MDCERLREFIEAPIDGTGYVFRGSGGSRMTALLQQRCGYLLENAAAGEGMLILLGSTGRLADWDRELRHIYPVEPRLCTFQGFVRQELEVFYPLAAAKCNGLTRTVIRPAFMDRDAAVNLVSKVVQHRREKDGIFSSLSSTSEKIASDILNSLDSAAMAGIPYDETFDRLYDSLEIKSDNRRKIYRDAGEIACDYRNKCLELGVLDTAASIELYCGFLLKEEGYKSLFKNKITYLIADDLQNWDEAQLLTAELLMPGLKSYAFGYDPEAACGQTNRLRRNKLIEERLLSRCHAVNAAKDPKTVSGLSEALYDAIATGKISKAENVAIVERHPATELRSEMLEHLGRRVCELIETEGFKPSDITILSTYADIVTELVLAGMLRSRGYGLTNLSAGENASGSRLCRALLVFTILCHPGFGIYPSKDDVRLLIDVLFGLDPPRASAIARKACNTIPFTALPGADWPVLPEIMTGNRLEDYLYVTAWIEDYKKGLQVGMELFLQRSLLEIFMKTAGGPELIKVKRLIDRTHDFCKVVSRFGVNTGRDFLSSAGYRMNVGESHQRIMEGAGTENVLLSTIQTYLGSGLKSRVTVICGLSSNNWSPARVRELVNPEVLSAAWKPGELYTAAHEESDRRFYLADIVRAVVQNCGERLITFESLLTANGYENDGILPDIFDAVL